MCAERVCALKKKRRFFSVFINHARLCLFDVNFFGTFMFNARLCSMHSLSSCHVYYFIIMPPPLEDMNDFRSLYLAFLNLKVSLHFG